MKKEENDEKKNIDIYLHISKLQIKNYFQFYTLTKLIAEDTQNFIEVLNTSHQFLIQGIQFYKVYLAEAKSFPNVLSTHPNYKGVPVNEYLIFFTNLRNQ